jgi:G3E family GTPase
MKRKDRFDYVMIETTGLADPGPVAQTFFVDDDLRETLQLDAIVTVVDARHVWERLKDSREAQEQIAFGDVILLNKTDLVSPADLDRLEERIKEMNATAKVIRCHNAQVAMDHLLNVGAFDLDRILEKEPDFLRGEHHHHHEHEHEHHDHKHDDTITSVGVRFPGDLDEKKLNEWIRELVLTHGPDLFRIKGILSVKNDPRRFVFQGVHMQLDGRMDRPWKPGETRQNTLVFIGRNLNRTQLEEGLRSCLA